ncbi:MAG TPA: ATP-binding cassette domain-containing protein [Chthoniobacterales bacterium]
MIEVENLTKRYSGAAALDGISFQVGKGEIVGFLGPNGAGKSTTMRILSGFMPPSSGRASVAGFDVCRESLRAREHVGYMPENVPLYTEMRVGEYLRYRAALKGVRGRKVPERVNDVLELCGLADVARKLIGKLSKGYRQRVGLADAMVHEPDLLILDEPTIGLDPNQIRQVRDLIRNLARHHTILLSSHILSEVELTCHRVIILNRGRIEALDTPQNLRQRLRSGGEIRLEIHAANSGSALPELKKIPGVQSARFDSEGDWHLFHLQTEAGADPREAIFAHCVSRGWKVRELTLTRTSLEDVFVEMTQPE